VPRLRTLHRGSRGRPVAPRGNITGFTFIDFPLIGKWIEMLKEIAPGIKRTMLIFNPNTSPYYTFFLRVAARTRIVSAAGIRLITGNLCELSKGYFATTFLRSR
jgi:hypothetical protein